MADFSAETLEDMLITQVGVIPGHVMDHIRDSHRAALEATRQHPDTFLVSINGPTQGGVYEFPFSLIDEMPKSLGWIQNEDQKELCETLIKLIHVWDRDIEHGASVRACLLLMWHLWKGMNRPVPEGETLVLFAHTMRTIVGNQSLLFYGGTK